MPTANELAVTAAESAGRRTVGMAVGVLTPTGSAVQGAGRSADDGPPPGADTLFQIGSVTKVITALLLADAVTRGETTLETPLGAFVPGAPDGLTLGQLAAQTSGLPRLPPGLLRKAWRNRLDPYREFSTADLEAALRRVRQHAPPGERYRYSNFGFGLLGEALVRLTGRSYAELVAERIAGPLGLRDTVVDLRPDQLTRKATGHARRHRPVPDWDLGAMPGAGAVWSTIDDLLVLLRAHRAPASTPLGEALRLVQEPRFRVSPRLWTALAWHLSPVGRTGRTALWHNGGTGGFRSFVALLPELGSGVAVLSNSVAPVDRVGLRTLQRLARP